MKLILSRKGFDSSSGGCPNPLFPDGRALALPIPDENSIVRYRDLVWQDLPLGTLVQQLTKGRVRSGHGAHLDPDLDAGMYPRDSDWCPVFGQHGSAEGHLQKQGVGPGDLFLFFGVFRPVERVKRRWHFVPGTRAIHRIWGWFQVADVYPVETLDQTSFPWLNYHPHLQGGCRGRNTMYLASKTLDIPGVLGPSGSVPGSGIWRQVSEDRCLTHPALTNVTEWRLPRWFYPGGRTPLSYHHNLSRWRRDDEHCYLKSVARGQEFVLDTRQYPEASGWLAGLFSQN